MSVKRVLEFVPEPFFYARGKERAEGVSRVFVVFCAFVCVLILSVFISAFFCLKVRVFKMRKNAQELGVFWG